MHTCLVFVGFLRKRKEKGRRLFVEDAREGSLPIITTILPIER
jgi:hypothetical protein